MLKDNIPEFIANEPQISDDLEAIQPELTSLRQECEDIEKQLYAITTDTAMGRWEKDYSLPVDLSLNLEQRRQRLLRKIRRGRILNKAGLKAFIKANLNTPRFAVRNYPSQYKFTVYIEDMASRDRLWNALYYARPAHLIFDIIEFVDVRRCGTFYCDTNPL